MQSGIDIIEVSRIGELGKNKRFLHRGFSKEEIAYCSGKKNSAQHFAVRFAAKEAIWKAVGNRKLSHRDISVKNDEHGKPAAVLPSNLEKTCRKLCISLSHTKSFAVAVAVLNE